MKIFRQKSTKPANANDLNQIQIVGEALQIGLTRRDGLRREGLRFEQEWIASLKQNPDDANRAEEWLEAQAWTESKSQFADALFCSNRFFKMLLLICE